MKNWMIIFTMLALPGFASCQIPVDDATVTIRVIDDDQKPIEGAKVGAGFELPYWVNQPYRARTNEGVTSSDGLVTLREKTSGRVTFGVTKDGYYQTMGRAIDFASQIQKGKRLEAEVAVILKKKVNPIAIYARKVRTEIPAGTAAVGFDLRTGDWVVPYGKGATSDIMFTLKRQFSDRRNYEVSVTITFPGKDDGVRSIDAKDADSGSALRLPRTAPAEGYESKLVASIAASESDPGHERAEANRSYFFRVRTVIDEGGKVKSALFGKIDGGFRLDAINSKTCFVLFTYYLNPTSNDRNMEFNPQKNLFTDLTSDERVTAP